MVAAVPLEPAVGADYLAVLLVCRKSPNIDYKLLRFPSMLKNTFCTLVQSVFDTFLHCRLRKKPSQTFPSHLTPNEP